jgi:hypothetical protein
MAQTGRACRALSSALAPCKSRRTLVAVVALASALLTGPPRAGADPEAVGDYDAAVRRIGQRRAELAARWTEAGDRGALVASIAGEIAASVHELSRHWLGTPWGLGPPQTRRPGRGKINCGTFVGRVLRDAGFEVDVARLQQQASQLIIRSFVDRSRMRRWSNAPIDRFVADVRAMGPGLFIIGLDFHVGLLIQTEDDLRFVHASYVTRTVVDEPARTALPIVDSGYRVVGKLLDANNVRDWIEGRAIDVAGR